MLVIYLFPRDHAIRFTGAVLVNFLADPVGPSHTVIDTEVAPSRNQRPTQTSISARVTDAAGTYEAQIEVAVTPVGQRVDSTRALSVIIPVTVR